MEKAAVTKARARWEKANAALEGLKSSQSPVAAASEWADYLLALNAIHSALEAGSKSDPSSRGWFGGKKGTQNGDPLLSYLRQARNAEEHGLAEVIEHVPGGVSIKGDDIKLVQRVDRDGDNLHFTLQP